MRRALPFHYAYIIVAVTFLTLLMSTGVRTTPSVIIRPLEADFGWDRASISFSVALSLFALGFGGPIGGSLVDRFGPKRVMIAGMALIALGLLPLLIMESILVMHLFWGVVVGIGTGMVSGTIGATVANRWINRHRGVFLGIFAAAAAAGQLVFLQSMVALAGAQGWRTVIAFFAAACAATIPLLLVFMRDRPEQRGTTPLGGPFAAAGTGAAGEKRFSLAEAARTRDFWLLAGSFFVCGYTTNGLIGTHLLPHTVEHGFVEVEAAGALALMGAFNIVGTLASGWLSDRYDNRKLLALYYGLRGLSLVALPFIVEMRGLLLFSIIYGLDWVATVPPTVNLTARRFGRGSLGLIYGWIYCAHMIGAGVAAQAGGVFRDWLGDYHLIFLTAAALGLFAAWLSLQVSVRGNERRAAAAA
jgi:MFS family permease